jgi:DNA repair protein SbcD/Mre11
VIKIIHTADNHLGMKFNGRNYSESARLSLIDNRFNALSRLVDLANIKKADLFIIAGDLFDTVNVPVQQIKKTAEILNRFSGVVLILPGNHDYYEENTNCLWQKLSIQIKSEQVIIMTKPQVCHLTIGDHEVKVYPGPCTSKHSATNAIGWIEQEDTGDAITIGIAHGHVPGFGPESDCYYNMGVDDLVAKDLDLWLLGHIHVPHPAQAFAHKPTFLYSGTHAADGFDCYYPGNAWYIELEKNTFKAEPMECSNIRFKEMDFMLSTGADIHQMEQQLAPLANQNHLLKLRIHGRLNEDLMQMLQQKINDLDALFLYLELENQVKMDLDPKYIDQQFQKDSLPHQLLTQLSHDPENYLALQTAYELINESRL